MFWRSRWKAHIVYHAASGSSSALPQILLLVAVFALMYFLFLRPLKRRQQQAARTAAQMRSSLSGGDEIVTVGGLYATVVDVDDESVVLEISPGVTARYDRNAIARTIAPAAETDTDDTVDDDDDESAADLEATANTIIEKKD
jgi:preprotein translocase subunit YajC